MINLSEMEMVNWLLEQVPVVTIMGLVSYYLYKYVKKKDTIIEAKDIALMTLAEKIISVTSLLEVKSQVTTKEHEECIKLLHEIKEQLIKGQ